MIKSPKEIYTSVAEKNSLDRDLVESVGTLVFQDLREKLNDPKELAYELPLIGTFNIRFRKFEHLFESFRKYLEAKDPIALARLQRNPSVYQNVEFIYNKIQEFREDKKETKDIRNEQNKSIESGENNTEEY